MCGQGKGDGEPHTHVVQAAVVLGPVGDDGCENGYVACELGLEINGRE
jgi:hypothetical protein